MFGFKQGLRGMLFIIGSSVTGGQKQWHGLLVLAYLLQCFLCAGGLETDQHLFLSCNYSRFVLAGLLCRNMGLRVDFQLVWVDFIMSSFAHLKGVVLLSVQMSVYHTSKEQNVRFHLKGIFLSHKLLHWIIKARTWELAFTWLLGLPSLFGEGLKHYFGLAYS